MKSVPRWVVAGYVPESAASRSAQFRAERIARRLAARYPQFGRDPFVPVDLRNRTSVLCSAFSYPFSSRLDCPAGLAARIRRIRSEFRSLFNR